MPTERHETCHQQPEYVTKRHFQDLDLPMHPWSDLQYPWLASMQDTEKEVSRYHRGNSTPIRLWTPFHQNTWSIKKVIGTHVSLIRNRTSSLIWLNRTERIILCRRTLACQQVEQRTLAHIGKAHTAHLEVVLDAPEGNDIFGSVFCCFLGRHGWFWISFRILKGSVRLRDAKFGKEGLWADVGFALVLFGVVLPGFWVVVKMDLR